MQVAVDVATTKQPKHANLETIINGFLPSLDLEANGTLTVPVGATLKVEGTLESPNLNTGVIPDTATIIGHLKVDEVHYVQ